MLEMNVTMTVSMIIDANIHQKGQWMYECVYNQWISNSP